MQTESDGDDIKDQFGPLGFGTNSNVEQILRYEFFPEPDANMMSDIADAAEREEARADAELIVQRN